MKEERGLMIEEFGTNEYRPGFCEVDQYLKLPREKDSWLLKPLIPFSGACLLFGQAKSGKSYLGIQLALALSGQLPDFLGFPVHQTGKVLYLQLDTPRSVWADRFEDVLHKHNLKYDSSKFLLADRESIEKYPFDILQPAHADYLYQATHVHEGVTAVIIDTLRESHSGDEDSSTTARNVITNLVGATHPAALIIISHDRKPNQDVAKDLLADHRGSSYITGRMDAIMRLTKTRLYYTGRSIEAGDIKLQRASNGLWQPMIDETGPIVDKILADPNFSSLRERGRALATLIGCTEEAAVSRLRRVTTMKQAIIENKGVK